MTSFKARDELVRNLKTAIDAGEMLDAVDIAQEIIAESRLIGNEADYFAAEMLTLIGSVYAERGFPVAAIESLAEADAEWARYEDGQAKLMYLARNAQFSGLALRSLGRHAESIAASELALRRYSAALLGIADPMHIAPEGALQLIAQVAAAITELDADGAEMFGTVTLYLVRICSNIAQSYLLLGEILASLPWLDVTYRAIESVGTTLRRLILVESVSAHHALFMAMLMLGSTGSLEWSEEALPAELAKAIDRIEQLGEEDFDLGDLPGARSFDSRFMVVQAQMRSGDDALAYAELQAMLADFGSDAMKRATILLSLSRVELRLRYDVNAAERKIAEALEIVEKYPGDAAPFVFAGQTFSAEVCLRRKAFTDARRWAATALSGILMEARSLEPFAEELRQRWAARQLNGILDAHPLEPFAEQLRQLAMAFRGIGNPAAAVFFAKLAAGSTAGVHRRLGSALPLMPSAELPSGHDDASDRLRGYLIEDGRLGEALTAGLLPTNGPLPPTTPSEAEFAYRFFDLATSAEQIDHIAANLARAELRHAVDRETLQQEQLRRFRDVIPWDDSTIFLHYNPLPDLLQVVIATSECAETWNIPVGSQAVAQAAFEFLNALVAGEPISRDPYDLLIRPIEEQLGNKEARRLVIAGGDFLRFLPFAALYDGEKYLVERYATVSWSASATATLKEPPHSWARLALLGYVRGRGVSAHGMLPSVPRELSAIAAACRADVGGTDRVTLLALDDAFTASALADAIAGAADIVHVATHFEANPADARESRIVLGDDTLLDLGSLSEFATRGSGLDLITLAACSTGLPAGRAADANVSASAVLHASGARSVASTLWPVRSSSTALLMDRFYSGLFASDPLDKAEALRQAQLDLLRGVETSGLRDDRTRGLGRVSDQASTEYSHPHHWAPFVLSGNWLSFPRAGE